MTKPSSITVIFAFVTVSIVAVSVASWRSHVAGSTYHNHMQELIQQEQERAQIWHTVVLFSETGAVCDTVVARDIQARYRKPGCMMTVADGELLWMGSFKIQEEK